MLVTICEDEPLVAEQLQRMIEDLFPALRVQLVTCRTELEAAQTETDEVVTLQEKIEQQREEERE